MFWKMKITSLKINIKKYWKNKNKIEINFSKNRTKT